VRKDNIILILLIVLISFVGVLIFEMSNIKFLLADQKIQETTAIPDNLAEYKMTSENDLLIPELEYTLQDLFEGNAESLNIAQLERKKVIKSTEITNYVTKTKSNIADFSDKHKKIIINGSLSCGGCLEYLDTLLELNSYTTEDTDIYFLIPQSALGTELEVELLNLPKAIQSLIYTIELGKEVSEDEYFSYGVPFTRFVNILGEIEVADSGWVAKSYWHNLYLVSLEKRLPYEGELQY